MTIDDDFPIIPKKDSLLGRIKARREQIESEQFIDLDVPRWSDPVLRVRYGPLDHEVIRKAFTHQRKAKDKAAADVNSNMDLLVKACIGVYAVEDDKEYGLGTDEEWTRFDPDLAITLGLPSDVTARQVVRAMYFTDGDIIATGRRIIQFSGYELNEGNDDLLGE